MSQKYILNDVGEPEPADLMTWARWFEANDDKRRVHYTDIEEGVHVSTVFLGLDHNYRQVGPPVLWETMIFGGTHDGYQERFTSQADAELGHETACRIARGEVEPR